LDRKMVRPPEHYQASKQHLAEFASHEIVPKTPLAHRPPPGEAEGEAPTPARQGWRIGAA